MSVGRGHYLPLWLRGNLLLFGGAGLALAVFVGTLAFSVGRPRRAEPTQPPRNALQNLNVSLGDRATIDLRTKSLSVVLKFSGLPEEAARAMTVKVSIDGAEAQVGETGAGQEVQASALLSDQVDNIVKTNGVGAVLLVKGTCEYGGTSAAFDVSATRMQVMPKSEKELELAFDNFPEPALKAVTKPRPKPSPSPTPTSEVRSQPEPRSPAKAAPKPQKGPPWAAPSSTPRPPEPKPTPASRPPSETNRQSELKRKLFGKPEN